MIRSSDYNHKLYEIAREGKSGDWELIKIVEPKGKVDRTYNCKTGDCYLDFYGEDFPTVWLYQKGQGEMFDGPHEQESNKPAVERARGRVLSCGQGIGLFPAMIEDKLKNGIVSQLDIVELNEDVVKLTWEYTKQLGNMQLKIENAWDYLESCKVKYNFIFIDIWPDSSQAIAENPRIAAIAKKCLSPGGEVRFWLQEIRESLKPTRGFRDYDESDKPCKICACFFPHANLYGGLCLEYADAYGYYLEGKKGGREVPLNQDLSKALNSLGFRTLAPHKLPNGKEIDILVESDGKRYLVEGKKDLTNRGEFDRLLGQIQQYSTLRKQGFSGLKLVIYGDVDHNLYIDLKNAIINTYGTWIVDLVLKGKIV